MIDLLFYSLNKYLKLEQGLLKLNITIKKSSLSSLTKVAARFRISYNMH